MKSIAILIVLFLGCERPPVVQPVEKPIKPAFAQKPIRKPEARKGLLGVLVYHCETKEPVEGVGVRLTSADFVTKSKYAQRTGKDGVAWFRAEWVKDWPGILANTPACDHAKVSKETEGVTTLQICNRRPLW